MRSGLIPPIRGLALAHALASDQHSSSNVRLATSQELLIRETIVHRSLASATRPEKTSTPTKLSRAREIYSEHVTTLNRNDIIELFIGQLGLTRAGATTYYSKLKGGE